MTQCVGTASVFRHFLFTLQDTASSCDSPQTGEAAAQPSFSWDNLKTAVKCKTSTCGRYTAVVTPLTLAVFSGRRRRVLLAQLRRSQDTLSEYGPHSSSIVWSVDSSIVYILTNPGRYLCVYRFARRAAGNGVKSRFRESVVDKAEIDAGVTRDDLFASDTGPWVCESSDSGDEYDTSENDLLNEGHTSTVAIVPPAETHFNSSFNASTFTNASYISGPKASPSRITAWQGVREHGRPCGMLLVQERERERGKTWQWMLCLVSCVKLPVRVSDFQTSLNSLVCGGSDAPALYIMSQNRPAYLNACIALDTFRIACRDGRPWTAVLSDGSKRSMASVTDDSRTLYFEHYLFDSLGCNESLLAVDSQNVVEHSVRCKPDFLPWSVAQLELNESLDLLAVVLTSGSAALFSWKYAFAVSGSNTTKSISVTVPTEGSPMLRPTTDGSVDFQRPTGILIRESGVEAVRMNRPKRVMAVISRNSGYIDIVSLKGLYRSNDSLCDNKAFLFRIQPTDFICKLGAPLLACDSPVLQAKQEKQNVHCYSVSAARWSPCGESLAFAWSVGGPVVISFTGCLIYNGAAQKNVSTIPICRDPWESSFTPDGRLPWKDESKTAAVAVVDVEWTAMSLALLTFYAQCPGIAVELPFYRAGTLGVTAATAGCSGLYFGSSRLGRVLIGADQLLVNEHKLWTLDAATWYSIPLPSSQYMTRNWPLRLAVQSPTGEFILTVGKKGVALYSFRLGRWRLFGNVAHERSLRTESLPIGWYSPSVFFFCFRRHVDRQDVGSRLRDVFGFGKRGNTHFSCSEEIVRRKTLHRPSMVCLLRYFFCHFKTSSSRTTSMPSKEFVCILQKNLVTQSSDLDKEMVYGVLFFDVQFPLDRNLAIAEIAQLKARPLQTALFSIGDRFRHGLLKRAGVSLYDETSSVLLSNVSRPGGLHLDYQGPKVDGVPLRSRVAPETLQTPPVLGVYDASFTLTAYALVPAVQLLSCKPVPKLQKWLAEPLWRVDLSGAGWIDHPVSLVFAGSDHHLLVHHNNLDLTSVILADPKPSIPDLFRSFTETSGNTIYAINGGIRIPGSLRLTAVERTVRSCRELRSLAPSRTGSGVSGIIALKSFVESSPLLTNVVRFWAGPEAQLSGFCPLPVPVFNPFCYSTIDLTSPESQQCLIRPRTMPFPKRVSSCDNDTVELPHTSPPRVSPSETQNISAYSSALDCSAEVERDTAAVVTAQPVSRVTRERSAQSSSFVSALKSRRSDAETHLRFPQLDHNSISNRFARLMKDYVRIGSQPDGTASCGGSVTGRRNDISRQLRDDPRLAYLDAGKGELDTGCSKTASNISKSPRCVFVVTQNGFQRYSKQNGDPDTLTSRHSFSSDTSSSSSRDKLALYNYSVHQPQSSERATAWPSGLNGVSGPQLSSQQLDYKSSPNIHLSCSSSCSSNLKEVSADKGISWEGNKELAIVRRSQVSSLVLDNFDEFWEDVRNGIAGLYVWCETTSNLSVLSINPVSTMSGTGKPIKFTQRTMWAPQNPSCSIPEASEYRYRVMKLFDTYCKSGVPMSLYNTLLVSGSVLSWSTVTATAKCPTVLGKAAPDSVLRPPLVSQLYNRHHPVAQELLQRFLAVDVPMTFTNADETASCSIVDAFSLAERLADTMQGTSHFSSVLELLFHRALEDALPVFMKEVKRINKFPTNAISLLIECSRFPDLKGLPPLLCSFTTEDNSKLGSSFSLALFEEDLGPSRSGSLSFIGASTFTPFMRKCFIQPLPGSATPSRQHPRSNDCAWEGQTALLLARQQFDNKTVRLFQELCPQDLLERSPKVDPCVTLLLLVARYCFYNYVELRILTRVFRLLLRYPHYMPHVIVYGLRKTEPLTSPALLYPFSGLQLESLFTSCLNAKQYTVASLYLLVIQNSTGPLNVRMHFGLILMQKALNANCFKLVKSLIDFFTALYVLPKPPTALAHGFFARNPSEAAAFFHSLQCEHADADSPLRSPQITQRVQWHKPRSLADKCCPPPVLAETAENVNVLDAARAFTRMELLVLDALLECIFQSNWLRLIAVFSVLELDLLAWLRVSREKLYKHFGQMEKIISDRFSLFQKNEKDIESCAALFNQKRCEFSAVIRSFKSQFDCDTVKVDAAALARRFGVDTSPALGALSSPSVSSLGPALYSCHPSPTFPTFNDASASPFLPSSSPVCRPKCPATPVPYPEINTPELKTSPALNSTSLQSPTFLSDSPHFVSLFSPAVLRSSPSSRLPNLSVSRSSLKHNTLSHAEGSESGTTSPAKSHLQMIENRTLGSQKFLNYLAFTFLDLELYLVPAAIALATFDNQLLSLLYHLAPSLQLTIRQFTCCRREEH